MRFHWNHVKWPSQPTVFSLSFDFFRFFLYKSLINFEVRQTHSPNYPQFLHLFRNLLFPALFPMSAVLFLKIMSALFSTGSYTPKSRLPSRNARESQSPWIHLQSIAFASLATSHEIKIFPFSKSLMLFPSIWKFQNQNFKVKTTRNKKLEGKKRRQPTVQSNPLYFFFVPSTPPPPSLLSLGLSFLAATRRRAARRRLGQVFAGDEHRPGTPDHSIPFLPCGIEHPKP